MTAVAVAVAASLPRVPAAVAWFAPILLIKLLPGRTAGPRLPTAEGRRS